MRGNGRSLIMGREKQAKISEAELEKLLDAWMAMAIGIKGNRILKTLSFNEMVICRLLCQAGQEDPGSLRSRRICL